MAVRCSLVNGSPRIMRGTLSVAATLICFTAALPSASADSSVYSWRDKNGTMTFSDNPTLAPKGTAVEVRSYITPAVSDEARAVPIMQRVFAQRLATELGLGDNLTAEQAAATLAKVGIAPPLGRWHLHEPMTSSLIERLRTLTAGAAVAGRIALDPEQAVIAFDTTTALVGIKIHGAAAPQTTPSQPVFAEPTPQPVYFTPAAPVVYDRVIYVGGDDPFFTGTVPAVIINQRVVNVDKVVVRPRVKPGRPQAPMRPTMVHRLQPPQGVQIINPPPPEVRAMTRAGSAQESAVAQYRVVRVRPGFRGAAFSAGGIGASSPVSAGGGYRIR
jgi:Domain of unknown function (DUF4124)